MLGARSTGESVATGVVKDRGVAGYPTNAVRTFDAITCKPHLEVKSPIVGDRHASVPGRKETINTQRAQGVRVVTVSEVVLFLLQCECVQGVTEGSGWRSRDWRRGASAGWLRPEEQESGDKKRR